MKGTSKNLLRRQSAALGSARNLAYLADMSRLLRSGRLASCLLITIFRGALKTSLIFIGLFLGCTPIRQFPTTLPSSEHYRPSTDDRQNDQLKRIILEVARSAMSEYIATAKLQVIDGSERKDAMVIAMVKRPHFLQIDTVYLGRLVMKIAVKADRMMLFNPLDETVYEGLTTAYELKDNPVAIVGTKALIAVLTYLPNPVAYDEISVRLRVDGNPTEVLFVYLKDRREVGWVYFDRTLRRIHHIRWLGEDLKRDLWVAYARFASDNLPKSMTIYIPDRNMSIYLSLVNFQSRLLDEKLFELIPPDGAKIRYLSQVRINHQTCFVK